MGRAAWNPARLLRARFRLLQLGLLLPVVVTGVFGAAYVGALRSRQEAVEAAGRQLARRVADRALAAASQRGNVSAAALLNPVLNLDRPSAPTAFAAMQSALDSLRRCRCGPIKEGSFFFYWIPATGQFATSGTMPPGSDPRIRLAEHALIPPGERDGIWGAGGVAESGPWVLHFAGVPMPGGREALIGFDISMASWWADTFLPAVVATRQQFFATLPDPDSSFSAYLAAGRSELAREPAVYDGPTVTVATSVASGIYLGVTMNPAVLTILFPGTPPPSDAVLIGALTAAVLVSGLALVLLQQVRRTVAQREAFVASISHELRTPLTEVLLHAESLHLDRQTPEVKGRAATAIVRETRRLMGLVENALTFAGAGRTDVPLQAAPIEAASVVRDSLRSLAPTVADHGATIETELNNELQCLVDPVALDRIATNLIENALRYGPAGQTVWVSLRAAGDGVELAVEDEGPGILPADRRRIWDPFERGAEGRRQRTAGVGLGLAIVRHLVLEAGGTVAVGAGRRGGARFVVNLPAPARA